MSQTQPRPTTDERPIPTAEHNPVDRHCEPDRLTGTGTLAELAETIREYLDLTSRIRFKPFGDWQQESNTPTRRMWAGYGTVVRIKSNSLRGSWSVSRTTGHGSTRTVIDDASRERAFRVAAEEMRHIALAS